MEVRFQIMDSPMLLMIFSVVCDVRQLPVADFNGNDEGLSWLNCFHSISFKLSWMNTTTSIMQASAMTKW